MMNRNAGSRRTTVRARLVEFAAIGFFAVALAISVAAATLTTTYIEQRSLQVLAPAIKQHGHDWLTVRPDGLLIELSGQAPGGLQRIAALATVEAYFSNDRIVDRTTVADAPVTRRNEFNLRLLQTDNLIQLFGEFPEAASHSMVVSAIADTYPATRFEDFSAWHEQDADRQWNETLEFGLRGFQLIPGANVFLTRGHVAIFGQLASQEELDRIKATLQAGKPDSLALDLQVTAPRTYLYPFQFRMRLDGDLARIDVCHTETEADRLRVLDRAARNAPELVGTCLLVRGAPSPDWTDAILTVVGLLESAGGGEVRIVESTISAGPLTAASAARFAEQADLAAAALPELFVLQLVAPGHFEILEAEPATGAVFTVAYVDGGEVILSGDVSDETSRRAVVSFAKASLNSAELTERVAIDASVEVATTGHILIGLEALSMLHSGELSVLKNSVNLTGSSSIPKFEISVSELFAERLTGIEYTVDVIYDDTIGVAPPPMDPRLCVTLATEIVEMQKISFEPGSARLKSEVHSTIGQLATVLQNCTHAPIEIAGHTDSQGREGMNLALSNKRARAVLDALLDRSVLTTGFVTTGYGETQPIADNGTEAGREANRRIEFRLREDAAIAMPQ